MIILDDSKTVKLAYHKIVGHDEPLIVECKKPDAGGMLEKAMKAIAKRHFQEKRNPKTKQIEPQFKPGHESAYKVDVLAACLVDWNVQTRDEQKAPIGREYLERIVHMLPFDLVLDVSRVARNQSPEECEVLEDEEQAEGDTDVSAEVRPQ